MADSSTEPDPGTVVSDGKGVPRFCAIDEHDGGKLWYPIDSPGAIPQLWEFLPYPIRLVSVPATQEPKPGPRRRPADDDYNYDFEAGLSEGLVQARDYLGSLEEAEESDILSRLYGWLDGRIGENRP